MRCLILLFALIPAVGFAAKFEKVGTVPYSAAAVAPVPKQNGRFYIADRSAGKFGCGQIQILQDRKTRPIHTFNGYKGKSPSALIAVRRDVYGITTEGGKHGKGTLFRIHRNRVQTLANFSEAMGAPESVQVSGRMVYGVCTNGVYRLRGNRIAFEPVSVPYSTAIFHGQLFVSQNYYRRLLRVDSAGPTVLLDEWSDWTVAGKKGLLAIEPYGGRYGQGVVTQFVPSSGATKELVNFQAYNGGHPTQLVVTRNGAIYSANPSGIWHVGKRPRKAKKISSTRFLETDGRKLYGLAGLLDRTVFVVTP